jgi:cytochrome c peroxidase
MRRFIAMICITVCWTICAALLVKHGTPYRFPELPYFPPMPTSPDNPVTEQGVALGRYLFYDSILSADSNMSCAGCHRQEAAFSDAPNAFSKGRNGVLLHRNTPPLFNLAWYPRLFWDGRAVSLEMQVLHPVRAHEEMNLQWTVATLRVARSSFYKSLFRDAFGDVPIDSMLIAKAIAQFERTLLSYRSKYDSVLARETVFTEEEFAGFDIMNDMSKGDCLHCHSTDNDALGVNPSFSNNGIDAVAFPEDFKDKGLGGVSGKKEDYGKFKVPTLRNIAATAPYMHDGRFKTLEAVIDFYSDSLKPSPGIDSKMGYLHRGGAHFSATEKKQIIAFLKTLTDSALLTDPSFSNPFRSKR